MTCFPKFLKHTMATNENNIIYYKTIITMLLLKINPNRSVSNESLFKLTYKWQCNRRYIAELLVLSSSWGHIKIHGKMTSLISNINGASCCSSTRPAETSNIHVSRSSLMKLNICNWQGSENSNQHLLDT